MSVRSGEATDQNRNEIFSALAHEDRRIVLRTLRRLSQMTIEELAVHLTATKTDKRLVAVTPQEATQATATLHHTHLPKLTDVGLIQQDAGTISITQHPVLQDPKITSIVETTSSDWTAVLSCLADTHRRIILSILSQHDEPMEKTELATAVLKQIQDERTAPLNVDTMCQKLFHVHLPKLPAADLISYDVDYGLVRLQA